jgi:hypothetical protein
MSQRGQSNPALAWWSEAHTDFTPEEQKRTLQRMSEDHVALKSNNDTYRPGLFPWGPMVTDVPP